MSSGSQEKSTKLPEELTRQAAGSLLELAASFFRAAAARIAMTDTDLQVMDILESTGHATAGQLADLTDLPPGRSPGYSQPVGEGRALCAGSATPTMVAGLSSGSKAARTKGRRWVLFLLLLGKHGKNWRRTTMMSRLPSSSAFLKRSNAMSREEIIRLQEAPSSEGGNFSAPLLDLERGRLVVFSAISRLTLRTAEGMAELYQARFEGAVPEVKAKDGVVTIRYPRRLSGLLGGQKRAAEVTLNVAIPWQIAIQGGASDVTAELGGLDLASLEVKGGVSSIRLELPMPSGVIPIRISGGASEIIVRRPVGVAARAHLKGWVSTFVFDDQTFSDMGNNVRLQSSGFEPTVPYYDIEVASSASMLTITTG